MTPGVSPMPSRKRLDCVPSGLFRHPAWLSWKASQGWELLSADGGSRSSRPKAEAALLRRDIGSGLMMAYAPGSPNETLLQRAGADGDELGAALERLSLDALPRLGKGCAFLRWDLPLPAWTAADGSELGARLLELRMNASTSERRLRKAPTEGCSVDTYVVDLSGGSEAVLRGMDARTRYSLRLARRRGTETVQRGSDGLSEFHALYGETMRRRGLRTHSLSGFEGLFAAAAAEGLDLRLYMAYSRGIAAAGAIIARYGGDAWYLFAASHARMRESAGPSAVLCRALFDCACAGDRRMDLLGAAPEGVDSHPLAGITRFKAGFGGARVRRSGAWDFVIDPEAYASYIRAEGLSYAFYGSGRK